MKKCTTIMLVAMLLAVVGCDPKWPEDSELEGQWQLTEIKSTSKTLNVKQEHRFWDFRRGVMMIESPAETTGLFYRYYSLYKRENDSLYVSRIYFGSQNEQSSDDDEVLTQQQLDSVMPSYGIDMHNERFRINEISNEVMVLSHSDKTLYFEKK